MSSKRARALSLFFSTESQELRRAQAQEYLVNKWLDGKWVLNDQIGSQKYTIYYIIYYIILNILYIYYIIRNIVNENVSYWFEIDVMTRKGTEFENQIFLRL